jgi:hypothetical protein
MFQTRLPSFLSENYVFVLVAFLMITTSFFFHGSTAPRGPRPPHCRASDLTLWHTIKGRNSLDEWSARRRDLYWTTHKTRRKKTLMPPCGIRTRNPSRRDALDRHLRPRRHRDRQWFYLLFCVKTIFLFLLRTDYLFKVLGNPFSGQNVNFRAVK